jgi:hypothetical protein
LLQWKSRETLILSDTRRPRKSPLPAQKNPFEQPVEPEIQEVNRIDWKFEVDRFTEVIESPRGWQDVLSEFA